MVRSTASGDEKADIHILAVFLFFVKAVVGPW